MTFRGGLRSLGNLSNPPHLRTHRIAAAATAALLLSLAASAAVAATDPNDVAGKLDLHRLTATKDSKNAPLTVTVRTFPSWKKSILAASGPNRLIVLFDTDGDGVSDFSGMVEFAGGALSVLISGSGQAFEPLEATRPTNRSVRFTVPGGSPPNPAGDLDVAARSRYLDSGVSCKPPCRDRLPDSGWVHVAAGGGGGGSFACTRVIGFSQTKNWWFLGHFETLVDETKWEIQAEGGQSIGEIADPGGPIWNQNVVSPCGTTDRVVLQVSPDPHDPSQQNVATTAMLTEQAIDTVRSKIPSVQEIDLLAVVGGPSHDDCGGVFAATIHPIVDQAISRVLTDVTTGVGTTISPEVSDCSMFRDGKGHLTDEGSEHVAQELAAAYS